MSNEDFTVTPPPAGEITPVWLRLPQAEALTGVSRSMLYEWIKEGRIRSASMRDPGSNRGIRLIESKSLFQLIESMAEGGAQ